MAKFIGSSLLNVSEVRQWDRNTKIAFVDKLISFVESSNGQKLTCSSSKVVAGKNASETNALLQALASSVINSRQQTQNNAKQNFLSSASSTTINSSTSAQLSSTNKQTNNKHKTKYDDDKEDDDDGGEEKRIALQSIAKQVVGEQTTFSTNQESHSANALPIRQQQSQFFQRKLSNNPTSADETTNSQSSEYGKNTSPTTYAKNKLKQQTQENKSTFLGRRETLVVSGNNLQMNDTNRDVSAKKSKDDKSETIKDEKKLQVNDSQENKQLRQDTFDQTNSALLVKLTNSFDTLRRQLDLLSLPSSQITGNLAALQSEFERRKQQIEISM